MAATAAVKEIFEALPHIKRTGAKHPWFDFDYEADVLYVSLERSQRATDTDILDDGVFLRLRDKKIGNYSGMLIGLPIAILYFLARKITAEGAEERRALNRLFPLCASPRPLRLNSRFGYNTPISRVVPA
ncbi:MAG: hypothetical protein U9N09_07325 [Euryarchaeota archaeon]|nr:hypothetical protein [Euryarchaeota archaeon]